MENGSMFQYRTVCTNVLGVVLERAMGERLATLLETEIWSRLAARHDAAIVVDPSGFPYVGAGMNACARDLANFGLMMINDGALMDDRSSGILGGGHRQGRRHLQGVLRERHIWR